MGKWGQKYRIYLRNHKREVYNAFQLMVQIAAQQGITERLKADDQTAWISAMNHVRSIAEETVLNDLIYC